MSQALGLTQREILQAQYKEVDGRKSDLTNPANLTRLRHDVQLMSKNTELDKPREQLIDMSIVETFTRIEDEVAVRIASGKTIMPPVLEAKTKDRYASAGKLNWAAVGEYAARYFNSIPVVETMYHPTEAAAPQEKKARERPAKKAAVDHALEKPSEAFDEAGGANVEKAKEEMESQISKLIKDEGVTLVRKGVTMENRKFVPMLPVIINPDSFSKTVEAFFILSFLVKEGKLLVAKHDSGDVLIGKTTEEEGGKSGTFTGNEIQSYMLDLDLDQYKAAIERYGLRKPKVTIDAYKRTDRVVREKKAKAAAAAAAAMAEGGAGSKKRGRALARVQHSDDEDEDEEDTE